MKFLSQQDINIRLQLIAAYIADFAVSVSNQFGYGQKCAEHNFKTLALLVGYIEALTCYQPITGNITEEDNCLSETEAQTIFDHISILTQITFAPIGATYI